MTTYASIPYYQGIGYGPACFGMGAIEEIRARTFDALRRRTTVEGPTTAEAGKKSFPWLYVAAGVVIVSAGAAFAYQKGWLRS